MPFPKEETQLVSKEIMTENHVRIPRITPEVPKGPKV
jgi:hypothetical protein